MRRQKHHFRNWTATFVGILALPMLSGCLVVNGQPCLTSCDGLNGSFCRSDEPLPGELESQALPLEAMAPPAMQPPHSRFHPVPTRPVFASRLEYLPPESEAFYPSPSGSTEAWDSGLPLPTPVEEILPIPPEEAIEELPADALPETVHRLPLDEEETQPDISDTSGPVIIDPNPQRPLSRLESEERMPPREIGRNPRLRR